MPNPICNWKIQFIYFYQKDACEFLTPFFTLHFIFEQNLFKKTFEKHTKYSNWTTKFVIFLEWKWQYSKLERIEETFVGIGEFKISPTQKTIHKMCFSLNVIIILNVLDYWFYPFMINLSWLWHKTFVFIRIKTKEKINYFYWIVQRRK